LPIIVGATALKGVRLARRGVPRSVAGAFAAGVGASFASTLASVRVIRAVERNRPFTIYAAYRATLAAVVLRRAWQNRNR
jgi:undecaprenyl-diphosphatase